MPLALLLNPHRVTEERAKRMKLRTAARGVVFDRDGNMALLHVSKKGYYKLPGGGVDPGENLTEAFLRECREEIGCSVKVTDNLGIIREYREKLDTLQISHCFVASVEGAKGKPSFTDDEKNKGFEPAWVKPDKALGLLRSDSADGWEGRLFIVPRDTAIIEEALRNVA